MEYTTVFYSSISLLFMILALKFYLSGITTRHKNKNNSLPSGPPSLGILGHLYLLKQQPLHHTLLKLSKKYGPIFSLRFGSRRVVVLTSLSLFQENFTKNDIVFANRPKHTLNKYVSYNSTTVTQSSYGDHWRNLRRIYTIEMFSNQRLNTFLSIREDEVKRLMFSLLRDSQHDFAKVEMKSLLFHLNFNTIMRMVVGKRYYGESENEPEARKFREVMFDIANNAGPTYPGDFLSILKWTDFGRYKRKVKSIGQRTDAFLQGLLDDHRSNRVGPESENCMLACLLSIQKSQPEEYPDDTIKGIIMIMMLAGTDTSAIMLDWIMSNLVNKPEILEKARAEVDSQIGQEHLATEAEVSNLRYIQGIISETLRLYPAAPLMVPHVSSDYCTLGGYHVPPDTMVLTNAWAIHRDPELWEDPTSFKPERFMKDDNANSKIIAFGMGRRACPGSGLSRRITGLCIASLVQCFEWKRVDEKLVDMDEGTGGVVVPKFAPLEVMCKARPIMKKVFPEAF